MFGSNDNKSSQKNQGVCVKSNFTPTHTLRTPTPRTYNGKEYYCASDVAHIIGVEKRTVSTNFRFNKLPNAFSCATMLLSEHIVKPRKAFNVLYLNLTKEASFLMDVSNDSKRSPKNQGVCVKSNFTPTHTLRTPTPRTYNGKEYYCASDVAHIIGVDRSRVVRWNNELWHGAQWFTADIKTHDGVYLYEIERVYQLKSVYHAKWMRGGYQPAPVDENQRRFEELTTFLHQLFDKIPESNFAYLITFKDKIETYSFSIANETQRVAMAHKAISLADNGFDVWHSVNPVNIEPTVGKRGDEFAVSYQTALVVDIDIRSAAHKGEPSLLAADFDEAKSFLPFTPSLIIFSGFGLHAYYIFDTPIKITNENREELKRRNNLLLDVIRQRANGKKIDGVGDLPRVLRTPYTFNLKLGADNAPLCHIVEDSGLRFTPDQIDDKLNCDLITATKLQPPTNTATENCDFVDERDFNIFRGRRMLDFVNPSTLTYDEWLAVGMALKNIGMDCSDWENWSRTDDRFKDGECQYKWNGFNRDGYEIGTLFHFAQLGGYDARETFREWYELNKSSKLADKKKIDEEPTSQIDSLKIELQSTKKALADFNSEKISALERLKNIETFDSKTVFSADVVTAAAFAKLFDKQAFSDFRREVKLYGDKHPTEKASVHDWNANVKDTADTLKRRQTDLLTRQNDILAQVHSLTFIADHDDLKNFAIPSGYSVSNNGIEKVAGENLITICRRPVVIKAKNFSVDDKIFKLELAYMTQDGRLETLPPTEAAIIFNRNKLVDLANNGLPVTSSNANLLVDYLDAFNAQNENNFPITYTVPRCGWYNFNGKDYFVDPRRDCLLTDEKKNINVVVDSLSQFAKSLRKVGSIKNWKRAYELAKKSPVARIIIAAAIAPILLKILGERNFLLYIYAPTRAGKTTALYLAASAVGDEKIIRSFDATKNGLAGAAADVNDFTFLIDEKQVADSRIKEQIDTLIYSLANGIGRTKLNKDSTLRKLQDWRTIAIMTGETQLLPDNVTGGANTRLLTIAAPKIILSPDDCKTIRDITKENFGLVFPLVIDKIFQLGFETLRKAYQKLVDIFSTKYPELLNEYCRYMAVLTLADAILNSVLNDSDTLPIDDAIQAVKPIFSLIPTNAEISDTERERDFGLAIIAQNQSRFIGGNVPLDRMQAFYGKLDDPEYIYIVAKFLQDACIAEGFDYRKLVDDLVADGFFAPADTVEKGNKSKLATVQKKIGKANTRCYRIKRSIFDGDE